MGKVKLYMISSEAKHARPSTKRLTAELAMGLEMVVKISTVTVEAEGLPVVPAMLADEIREATWARLNLRKRRFRNSH